MASSAAVVRPPPPKPSNLDNDVYDEDEDILYEEIEEEIEVEEEFEVEVYEEDELEVDTGDDEIGEDLTPVREENQVIDMDLEDSEDHLQSVSMTRELSVSNPVNEIPTTQEDVAPVKASESHEKEELLVNGEITSVGDAPKSPFCDSGKVNPAESTPLVGEDCHAALIMTDASRVKDNTGDANHTVKKALADTRQMSPRSHVSPVRFREPSSDAEFHRENKKLRIICEFHAKGWCIKGNSCRFLHIKDGLDDVVKKNEPLERQASSSGFVLPLKREEYPISNCETDKLLIPVDGILGDFPLYGGGSSFGHNLFKDNYRYPYGNFIGTSHDDHHISRLSAFGTTVGEIVSKTNGMVPTDLRSAELPYSLSRRPLSLGLSSWNTDALGIRSLCKSDTDYHASTPSSLKRNISPTPCSDFEILLRNCAYRDLPSDKKLSSDYWELSAPFRPSHAITRNLLMKENLYDRIRDMEQMGDEVGRMKFLHSDQGVSIKDVNNVQSNSFPEDGKLLDAVKHNKSKKVSFSSDSKLRSEEQRSHKVAVKVNGPGKHEETDSHSKALNHFQAELIEFVKELVRPTWHKGLLSREAHKVIVKKAADKVISTLQPQNIPCTDESIKSYLSSSLPKLEKLVEAYIEKYGKT